MTRPAVSSSNAVAAGLLLCVALAVVAAQASDGDGEPRYVKLPLDGLLRSGRSSLGLVPFPRVGKRARSMGLVPFPRVGRARSMGLVPFPRVGRARSMGLVPFPRVGRARSMGLVPFPRVGRGSLDLDKRQSLIPYPRIGKKSILLEAPAQDVQQWVDVAGPDGVAIDEVDIEEPSKRDWGAPRMGGYKRAACTSRARCTLDGRMMRIRSGAPFTPRLGGE